MPGTQGDHVIMRRIMRHRNPLPLFDLFIF